MDSIFTALNEIFTALLLFGGAILWTWVTLIVFLIVCFISDVVKNGIVAFVALLILCGMYRFFGDWHAALAIITWKFAFGYLLIGFLYSGIRTIAEGIKLGKRMLLLPTKEQVRAERDLPQQQRKYQDLYTTQEQARKDYGKKLKGNASRWWFLWWISAFTWAWEDGLKYVWDITWNWLKTFYDRLLDFGIGIAMGKRE